MAIFFMLLLAAATGGFLWLRYRFRVWKVERGTRRTLTAHATAKAKSERKRPLAQRVHTLLPDAAVRRLLRWSPRQDHFWHRWGAPKVRIARTGLFAGWPVRINPAQHVMVVGMTGSGKSSALRVLGAWALRRPDWKVEPWDGKWAASVAPYRPHTVCLADMPAIEARLADLVERELPARALMTNRPHLAIIMDESRLLNELSGTGMRNLVTAIQTGRELGVHFWLGLQDPKADSVPTEIRDQFTAKIAFLIQNAEGSQVIFKELAAAGWRPDKLDRSGQCLVWEPHGRKPRPLFGVWLDPSVLAATTGRVCLIKVPRPRVRSSVRSGGIAGQTPVMASDGRRTDERPPAPKFTDRQSQALSALDVMGSLGPAALGVQLGITRPRAHEVLKQLEALAFVAPVGDGSYALTAHADAPKELDR